MGLQQTTPSRRVRTPLRVRRGLGSTLMRQSFHEDGLRDVYARRYNVLPPWPAPRGALDVLIQDVGLRLLHVGRIEHDVQSTRGPILEHP